MKAVAFDAYGTLFDVFSVTALGEELFPGKGDALAQLWRLKQLQYSMLRSLMGRHRDFWRLTEDALVSPPGLDRPPPTSAPAARGLPDLTAFPM
jgi:2-haloacid dehalogenase